MKWTAVLGNPVTWIVALTILSGLGTAIWWASSIHTKVGSFSDFMTEIRTDIKKIFDRLPPKISEGTSPIELTAFGNKLSQDLDAKTWAKSEAPNLVKHVQNQKEFEIFRFCEEYVRDMKLDDDHKHLIQEVAYDYSLSTASVMEVFPIELRDELSHCSI